MSPRPIFVRSKTSEIGSLIIQDYEMSAKLFVPTIS